MVDASREYIHGYGGLESERLQAQADSVLDLRHADTAYPAGRRVLEAGCGPGAQTVALARRSPGARIVAVDRCAASLAEARARVAAAGLTNVEFCHADLFALPFGAQSFEDVFVCFVLEHLSQPVEALALLKRLLKPAGTITVFEGDHGSAYFYPDSDLAHRVIACQVELQRRAGGDPMIGRRLYPLLVRSGFARVRVSPRVVYVDGSCPELAERFTKKTFTAMVAGVRDSAIEAGLIAPERFDAGIRDLVSTAESDGVFCYTFFKAVACATP
jgi:SAM-dependent methyltransferase